MEEILQEWYRKGIAEGLTALRNAIRDYKDVTGKYPRMEYLYEEMIPELVDSLPLLITPKPDDSRLN